MANEPFANQNWPTEETNGQTPNLGTGEGETPLATPPNPKIDLRTMASDLNSSKESGGGAPQSYTPNVTPQPEIAPEPTPSFEPAKIGNTETVGAMPMTMSTAKKSKKGLFLILVVLIVVVGLGAAGYFFVYPMFSAKAPAQAPTQEQTPAPTPSPTQANTPGPSVTPGTEITNHVSLFKTSADTTADIALATTDITGFKNALPFDTADVSVLKEVILRNSQNNILTTPQVLSLLFTNDFTNEVANSFNPDPTVFVYTDQTGSWPGIVLALGANSQITQAKINLELEANTHLNNIFLNDPGTAGLVWKDGLTNGFNNRYLNFSNSGFSLNYTWVGNDLLISSSYAGFKTALQHLQ